jgi:hypothetical protein
MDQLWRKNIDPLFDNNAKNIVDALGVDFFPIWERFDEGALDENGGEGTTGEDFRNGQQNLIAHDAIDTPAVYMRQQNAKKIMRLLLA